MMSRQQLHHLSGAYVLGALDADERAMFEERLPDWEDMRSEVTELADTAVALGLAVPPIEPGADLRRRILELAARTPQLPADVPPAPVAAQPVADVAARRRPRLPARRAGAERNFRSPAGRRSRTPRSSGIGVLAAVGAAALALIAAVQFGPAMLGGPELTVAAVAAADDARRIEAPLAGARGVELLYSVELEASVLAWDELPPLAEGQVYELWYVAQEARPAGLLPADGNGGAVLLDGELVAGDMVGVTVEPAGGSEQPTTDPVMMLGPLA